MRVKQELKERVDQRVDETVDERIDELTNMTCKDCKYFYQPKERETWQDNPDIGYCDQNRYGTVEVHKDCPVNRWCDNKFERKDNCWESVSK